MSADRRPGNSGSPTWWVILMRELGELWLGGRALHLILMYSLLLGLYSFLLATNSELKLMPLNEMVFEMVKAAIAVSLFICLIIAAESVSGERERATLEGLLLTPGSRTQILAGKFLAAVSPWPVALAIALPYWHAVSQGDPVFDRAALWGAVAGSFLAPALAGLGVLVSLRCNTIKASMIASLALYILLLVPSQTAGPSKVYEAYSLWYRNQILQWVNPMAACSHFLKRVILDNWNPDVLWIWFTIPLVFAGLILVLLFQYSSASLRLEAQTAERFRPYWDRMAGLWRSAGVALRSAS